MSTVTPIWEPPLRKSGFAGRKYERLATLVSVDIEGIDHEGALYVRYEGESAETLQAIFLVTLGVSQDAVLPPYVKPEIINAISWTSEKPSSAEALNSLRARISKWLALLRETQQITPVF